jgi:general secretion pathway protein G
MTIAELRRRRSGGFTIAELITVVAIIAILASVALPVARFGLRRQKDHELMTMAALPPQPGQPPPVRPAQMQALGSDGYPKDLDELLKGIEMSDGRTVRLLRERDLIDPMTGRKEWIVLSTTDDPESSFSDVCTVGGSCSAENVFEVHSTSTALALDGKTHYNEW